MLKLYNTLTRKKQEFRPLEKGRAGMYTCGPTVYLYAHIGNLRTYVFEDILKRVLEYNGYKVKHVMNITDVGHLTSDADTGEDKLEKGAKKEKKTVWEIARFYTRAFQNDLKELNVKSPDIWIKATKTIKEQIGLIKTLEKKGFTYQIKDGVYFDTSKLDDYGRLWGGKKKRLKPGARVKMVRGKKNPTDFALWKLSPKNSQRQMEWPSPWGVGFPGWHTECVVMGTKELGIPFDIHCGGIDHIPVHHTNEIAQAEAAFGKVPARYWLHGEFLVLKKGRMGKSEGNIIILNDLTSEGFNPLSLRYLYLTAHYRSKLVFSRENLRAAERGLQRMYDKMLELKGDKDPVQARARAAEKRRAARLTQEFLKYVNDDLDMPRALALAWKALDDKKISGRQRYELLADFDKVFGLDLGKVKRRKVPGSVLELSRRREKCRQQKNWQKADELRQQIEKLGWQIEDTPRGAKIKKKNG